MKAWFGRFRSGDAAIAFPRATLLSKAGRAVRTDLQWWRIRRIFGIGGRRWMIAVIQTDAPTLKHLETPA